MTTTDKPGLRVDLHNALRTIRFMLAAAGYDNSKDLHALEYVQRLVIRNPRWIPMAEAWLTAAIRIYSEHTGTPRPRTITAACHPRLQRKIK